ncbi:MAG: MoaD/ThiS family protein [Anaerolineales bacterium]|nr:MoaD/ThiS family protein [Anaerolineales bacterium]
MTVPLEITQLEPEPAEEWRRVLRFVGWGPADRQAAARSVEALFRRGPELVAATYDYLLHVPETAAILGWDEQVDPAHLEERRRFFTVWLARTLGLDTSTEMAEYLFRAGQWHAGQGPRRIHTPPEYVTGSMGLVQASFARYMLEAGLPADLIAGAGAAWNKLLAAHLNQMLLGYRIGRDLTAGPLVVRCRVFGRLRPLVGAAEARIHAAPGAPVAEVLRKFFNSFPQTRAEALDRVWRSEEAADSLWVKTTSAYVARYGWRVLHNGRDLEYSGSLADPVQAGDDVAIFPPGR